MRQRREENLPTKQHQAQAHPRVSRPHGDQRWSQGDQRSTGKGPQAAIGVAKPNGFPKRRRLNSPREFSRVLRSPQFRFYRGSLRVFASDNAALEPRLGLVVGRRAVRRAHDRNRLKRTAREVFRQHCQGLPSLDIVLHLRGPVHHLELKRQLEDAFKQMRSQAPR